MTRSQLQQVGTVALLLAFVAAWVFTRQRAGSPEGQTSASSQTTTPAAETQATPAASQASSSTATLPAGPATGTPPEQSAAGSASGESAPASEPLPTVSRDPFTLPPRLKELFRKKALEKEQAKIQEAARLQQQQRPRDLIQGTPKAAAPLQLTGILWGTSKPQAIINRKIVSAGDTVEQAEVLAVTKEGVTVLYNGQEIKLVVPKVGEKGERAER